MNSMSFQPQMISPYNLHLNAWDPTAHFGHSQNGPYVPSPQPFQSNRDRILNRIMSRFRTSQTKPRPFLNSKRPNSDLKRNYKQQESRYKVPMSFLEKFGLVLSVCSFLVGIIVLIWSQSMKSRSEYITTNKNVNKKNLKTFNDVAKIFAWFKLFASITAFGITIISYLTRNNRIVSRNVNNQIIRDEINQDTDE